MQTWQAGPSWCGSLAAGLVQLVFQLHWVSVSQLGDCCCRVVDPAGTKLQAPVHSLTGFIHCFIQIFQHLLFFTFRGFEYSLCIFILATDGQTHWESNTKTIIIFSQLQYNLFIKQPLNSSQSALHQKEAGSDCCVLCAEVK